MKHTLWVKNVKSARRFPDAGATLESPCWMNEFCLHRSSTTHRGKGKKLSRSGLSWAFHFLLECSTICQTVSGPWCSIVHSYKKFSLFIFFQMMFLTIILSTINQSLQKLIYSLVGQDQLNKTRGPHIKYWRIRYHQIQVSNITIGLKSNRY